MKSNNFLIQAFISFFFIVCISVAVTIPIATTIFSDFSGTIDLSLNSVGHLKIQSESVRRF
jgi:hypothetical protein